MSLLQHLIGGELIRGDGPDYIRPSPIDDKALPISRLVTAKQTDHVVSNAIQAKEIAFATDLQDRSNALRSLASKLQANAETFANMITSENGCPKDQSVKLQVTSAVGVLEAYADLALRHPFSESRKGLRGGNVIIQKHAIGVSVGIVPWNVPLFLACMKLGPAIAAGCPIILKPSPENVNSMALFAKLISELPLPKSMVQLATGDRDLGEALVAHEGVSKVSFTGSTSAGRQVARVCAGQLKACTLELGGKSAAILLDDFELEAVKEQFFLSLLQNNGQVCGAQSRVLVPKSRFIEILDQITSLFNDLSFGDPRQLGTQIGPVATQIQKQRIEAMLESSNSDGIEKVSRDFNLPATGSYVAPALYVTQNHKAKLYREEIFGPITVVSAYSDEAEAIRLANDSQYGLSGSVWGQNIDRAAELAMQLRTGSIGINSKKILDFGAPFGGFRQSGLGRELGPEGIEAYLEASSILLPENSQVTPKTFSPITKRLGEAL